MNYIKTITFIFLLLSISACQKENTSNVASSPKNTVSLPTMSKGKMVVDPELNNFMDGINKLPVSSSRNAAVMSYFSKRKTAVVKTETNVVKENSTFKDSSFDYGQPIFSDAGVSVDISQQLIDDYTYAYDKEAIRSYPITWKFVGSTFNIFSVQSDEKIDLINTSNNQILVVGFWHLASYMVVTMPCPVSWSEYEYNLYPDPHYLPTYSTVASANVKGSLSTLGYNYANVNSYVAINLGHN